MDHDLIESVFRMNHWVIVGGPESQGEVSRRKQRATIESEAVPDSFLPNLAAG